MEIPNNSKETLEPISLKTNPDCNVALMHHHISQVVRNCFGHLCVPPHHVGHHIHITDVAHRIMWATAYR